MTHLERDTATYWRTSQTLRGLRDGYPVVAESLLSLVALYHAKDRLGKLADSNSYSRFAEPKEARVINIA